MIRTTQGDLDESALARTLGFEDRPDTYVLWVEWRHDNVLVRRDAFPSTKTLGPVILTSEGELPADALVRCVELYDLPNEVVLVEIYRRGDDIVKRSAHVILKRASTVATALAASIA